MNINRLTDTPYFSEDFLKKLDNSRQNASKDAIKEFVWINDFNNLENYDYADICLLFSMYVKYENLFFTGEWQLNELPPVLSYLERLPTKDLEKCAIRTIVGVYMDYSQPSKEYWNQYQGRSFDDFMSLWAELDSEYSVVYKNFLETRKLDVLFDRAFALKTIFEMKQFEDFTKRGLNE